MDVNIATVSAFIGLLGGILGILNQLNSLRKEQTENIKAQAVREQQLDDKLKALENKIDEHNGWGEKFMDMTNAIVEIRNDIKWLKGSKS